MGAEILRGLGRFIGLTRHEQPITSNPDRLGYLIVNEAQFAQTFSHLGKKTIRALVKEYGQETYSRVHPEALIHFLGVVTGINPETKTGEKANSLLGAVIRVLTYQRDRQEKVFSLYLLLEQLGLGCLLKMKANTSLPKTLRESLSTYLESLPGYRDAIYFDEGMPISCYTHHQVFLKPLLNAGAALDKRSLAWFKQELDVAGALLASEGNHLEAHRQARHLLQVNRKYLVMDEEDLIAQLMLRGFSERLNIIINSIED